MFADALARPPRFENEAAALAHRQVIKDRTELYERMLGYHEDRAAYVARCSWHQRRGHFHIKLSEMPDWPPLTERRALVISQTLHCDVSAEFWSTTADELADWSCIVADLVDSAENESDRRLAACDLAAVKDRIKEAREFAKMLRAEHARRASAGRAA